MDNTTSHMLLQTQDQTFNMTQWMFESIQPYIKGRTIEMDSSKSLMYKFFIKNDLPLHLNCTDGNHRNALSKMLYGIPQIRSIHKVDFHHTNFMQLYSSMLGVFDTVIFLNENAQAPMDKLAIRNAQGLLRMRGHLIVLVPCNIALFHGIDPDWEDLKIKNRPFIKELFPHEFEIMKTIYMNLPKTHETQSSDPVFPSVIVVSRKNNMLKHQ